MGKNSNLVKEPKVVPRNIIIRRYNASLEETWPWNWAALDFIRWWETFDAAYVRRAQNDEFNCEHIKKFRGVYSVFRSAEPSCAATNHSIRSTKPCCEAARHLGSKIPSGYGQKKFDEGIYLQLWKKLSDDIGKKTEVSGVSKFLWYYYPEHVPLYDQLAKRSLAAILARNFNSMEINGQNSEQYKNYFLANSKFISEKCAPLGRIMEDYCIPSLYKRRVADKFLLLMAMDEDSFRGIKCMMNPTGVVWPE